VFARQPCACEHVQAQKFGANTAQARKRVLMSGGNAVTMRGGRTLITFLVCLLCAGIVLLIASRIDRNTLIASDANIIFYNSPAAVRTSPCGPIIIGYLTRAGLVRVQVRDGEKVTSDTVVHSFASNIMPIGRTADDHAAPALHVDTAEGVMYVAVAYHGTDLLVFKSPIETPRWTSHSVVAGHFAYPRFISGPNGTIIAIREIIWKDRRASGNLVSIDLATSQKTIFRAARGQGQRKEIVYATIPYVHDGTAYFAFTLRNEQTNLGLFVGMLDIASLTWTERSLLRDENLQSPVPSAIWSDGSRIRIGLSEQTRPGKNDTIRIIELTPSSPEREIYRTYRPVMYYQNVVAFHPSGTWLISNGGLLNYPQYLQNDPSSYVSVASNSGSYSIRDFNTRLMLKTPAFCFN
jgi:hypothetical protein